MEGVVDQALSGNKLSNEQIKELTSLIEKNQLDDETLMSIKNDYFGNNISDLEIMNWIKAFAESPHGLSLRGKWPNDKKILDKHSIGGGVGDCVSLLIVPIISSLNNNENFPQIIIPKISTGAITSVAGTGDRINSLAVKTKKEKLMNIAIKEGGFLVNSEKVGITPADSIIINRTQRPYRGEEDKISIDPLNLTIISILSKKWAVGAQYIVLDCPRALKYYSEEDYEILKKKLKIIIDELISKEDGFKKVSILRTRGEIPISNAVGAALEAKNAINVLKTKDTNNQLAEKAILLSSELLYISDLNLARNEAEDMVKKQISSGEAYKKLKNILKAQGSQLKEPFEENIVTQDNIINFPCWYEGIIHWSTKDLNKIAMSAGARYDDLSCGIELLKIDGERVKRGEIIVKIYYRKDMEKELHNAIGEGFFWIDKEEIQ